MRKVKACGISSHATHDMKIALSRAMSAELAMIFPAASSLPAPKRLATIAWVPTPMAASEPPNAHSSGKL